MARPNKSYDEEYKKNRKISNIKKKDRYYPRIKIRKINIQLIKENHFSN